jgi:DinB family
MTEQFLAELDREAARSTRALEVVPFDDPDWKPHDKSMPLGRLAMLVATMPSWFEMIVNRDDLDVAPVGGSNFSPPPITTAADLVRAQDTAVAAARKAFEGTTDDYLISTNWKLLAGGHVVMEQPRYLVIRDSFNHLAHHRGQLTVYLRLRGAKVPAIYGPSADDQTFA